MAFLEPQQNAQDDELLARYDTQFGPSTDNQITVSRNNLPPFELKIQTPRGVALDAKYAGSPDRTAVIIHHGITPFPVPGKSPRGVWGLGYEVKFPNQPHISTKEWMPVSKEEEIGQVSVLAHIDSVLNGHTGAEVIDNSENAARARAQAALNLGVDLNRKLRLNALEIIAGGVCNGVRWQMYSQGNLLSLQKNQEYKQLITVPTSELRNITIRVRAWVRARNWFGFAGTTQWNVPDSEIVLPIE